MYRCTQIQHEIALYGWSVICELYGWSVLFGYVARAVLENDWRE
jgi:hypothetical protein